MTVKFWLEISKLSLYFMWLFLTAAWVVGCSGSGGSRAIDCLAEIRTFNQSLIQQSPAVAAAKFQKMQRNVQAFNRGLNHLFYQYVRDTGLPDRWMGTVCRQVVLQGDFHVENIGAYKEAGGKVVVDIMDFDDSLQGPALLDIYRCASSLQLVASSEVNKDRLVKAFVNAYADTMGKIAAGEMSGDLILDAGSEYGLVRTLAEQAAGANLQTFYADVVRTRVESGKRVFIYSQDYVKAPQDMAKGLLRSYLARKYRDTIPIYKAKSGYVPVFPQTFYEMQDAVLERAGGIGSAGAFKVRILVAGPTPDPSDDVVLEFKQETVPAGLSFATKTYEHQGQRVLLGQEVMQTLVPAGLGTATLGKKQFFVSQIGLCYQELHWNELVGLTQMREATTIAGVLLAKGHARTSLESGAVAREMSSLIEQNRDAFLKDVQQFSSRYEEFLKKGYEKFNHQLTLGPLLFILFEGFCMGSHD